MHNEVQHKVVSEKAGSVLLAALSANEVVGIMEHYLKVLELATHNIKQDLSAYVERDPASQGQESSIIECSTSFLAVICYRLSQALSKVDTEQRASSQFVMQRLCSYAKKHSGIEIHPSAKIGKRFVIDHGCGTVIGETCDIGDDCYFLSNVLLGARGIANNTTGKRHPTIGNGVEIGCGSRLLGPIVIGDNVFIAPSCVVTNNIPHGSRVSVANQLQISRSRDDTSRINMTAYVQDESLILIGDLERLEDVTLVDENNAKYFGITLEKYRQSGHYAEYLIISNSECYHERFDTTNISLSYSYSEIVLINPNGLLSKVKEISKSYKSKTKMVDVA